MALQKLCRWIQVEEGFHICLLIARDVHCNMGFWSLALIQEAEQALTSKQQP